MNEEIQERRIEELDRTEAERWVSAIEAVTPPMTKMTDAIDALPPELGAVIDGTLIERFLDDATGALGQRYEALDERLRTIAEGDDSTN